MHSTTYPNVKKIFNIFGYVNINKIPMLWSRFKESIQHMVDKPSYWGREFVTKKATTTLGGLEILPTLAWEIFPH